MSRSIRGPWNPHKSRFEDAALRVLNAARDPLTLDEIVERAVEARRLVPMGRTPSRSLYSIILRREQRRLVGGQPTLFTRATNGPDRRLRFKLTDAGRSRVRQLDD